MHHYPTHKSKKKYDYEMNHQVSGNGKTLVIGPLKVYMNDCCICGKHSETRPYWHGKEICYDCGQLPAYKAVVEQTMQETLGSAELVIVNRDRI